MDSQIEKTAGITAVQEEPRKNDDGKSRRWRFCLSRAHRITAIQLLKAVVIGQMISRPLNLCIDHLADLPAVADFFNELANLTEHVSYSVSVLMMACAVACSYKVASFYAFATFAFSAACVLLLGCYAARFYPEVMQNEGRGYALAVAVYMLFVVLFAYLGRNRMLRAAQDAEAGLETSEKEGKSTPHSEYQALVRSARLGGFPKRALTFKKAFALLAVANVATLYYQPPPRLTGYLSTLNCEVNMQHLDEDDVHFEFSAHPRNSSFFGCNSDMQQLVALARSMNAFAASTTKPCTVYCFRTGEEDQLLGLLTQSDYDALPDMWYCRGQHASDGCEADGEQYGYDTQKEGWLNDVYGWSLYEESDESAELEGDGGVESATEENVAAESTT